jgi:hypothetical protein
VEIKEVKISGILFSFLEVQVEGTGYLCFHCYLRITCELIYSLKHFAFCRGQSIRYCITSLVNIFFILIIGGGKGREMRRRGGRGDGGGDGTMCKGIIPLSDDRVGKAKGSCKVFVCHSIPTHGKFGQNEEGWGGALICDERDKLRGFKPVPRAFVVHVRYTDEGRLLTAWKGAPRSVLKGMVAIGMAWIKLIGLPKGVQRVRKGYD